MMAYVPVSHAGALALRAGQELGPSPGCAATASLLAALGANTDADEAGFAALSNAGVLDLLLNDGPHRLVLAVEVADAQVTDHQTPQGEVEVAAPSWRQVQSLFADEPAAAEAVAAARRAARQAGGLTDALATPAVEQLLDTYDLLWFAVAELDQLG